MENNFREERVYCHKCKNESSHIFYPTGVYCASCGLRTPHKKPLLNKKEYIFVAVLVAISIGFLVTLLYLIFS